MERCIRTQTNARQGVQAPQKPVTSSCRQLQATSSEKGDGRISPAKGGKSSMQEPLCEVEVGNNGQPNNNKKIIADNLKIYTPMLHRNRPIRTFLIEGIDPVGQILPFQGFWGTFVSGALFVLRLGDAIRVMRLAGLER